MTAMIEPALALFLMFGGHAIADQPLQTPAMSAMKYLPFPHNVQGLAVHGLIHGFFVAAITGIWWLGAAETVAHIAIDWTKSLKRINHVTDQILHLSCKIIWATILTTTATTIIC